MTFIPQSSRGEANGIGMRVESRANERIMAQILVAATLAVPIAAISWFEILYLWFGITGEDPPSGANLVLAVAAFAGALIWSWRGSTRIADVIRNACRLGIALSIALPIVAVAVLLIWVNASGRRDLGMGGLALYSMPVVAFVAAVVLVIAFGIGRRLAQKRLEAT